ncbi:MAG: DUF1761 domain-containing protein [Bacteroidia bacterium]|jgi:hypothetical protein|nr:DUF1761 domain-containing protein [Bacteroidia bacterium]
MSLGHFLSHANWLAIIVSGLAYFAIGAVWYQPAVFGKAWAEGHNLTIDPEKAKKQMPVLLALTGVLTILVAILIGFLVSALYSQTVMSGAKIGLFAGAIISCCMAINYAYISKSVKTWLIDAMYHVLGAVLCGIIISIWH